MNSREGRAPFFTVHFALNYYVFYLARLTSLVGAVLTSVALPLLVLRQNNDVFSTSAITAASTIPYLLFGFPAGAIADRVPAKRLMMSAHLVASLGVFSIPVAALNGGIHPAHALAVAFVSGSCFVWFDAACFGLIPRLVTRERLAQANSLLQSSGYVIESVVPALAGILIATMGAANVIGIEAVLLIIAVLILTALKDDHRAAPNTSHEDRWLIGEIRDGVSFIFRHPAIRAFTLIGLGSSFINGAVLGLLAPITHDLLHITGGDPRAGIAWTTLSIGSVCGALCLPIMRKTHRMGLVTVIAASCYPMALYALAVAPTPIKLAMIALWGFLVSLVVLNGIVSRQQLTPANLQARVNTTGRMVAYGGTPFGALLAGFIASQASAATTLIMLSALSGALAVAVWLSPLSKPMGDSDE